MLNSTTDHSMGTPSKDPCLRLDRVREPHCILHMFPCPSRSPEAFVAMSVKSTAEGQLFVMWTAEEALARVFVDVGRQLGCKWSPRTTPGLPQQRHAQCASFVTV